MDQIKPLFTATATVSKPTACAWCTYTRSPRRSVAPPSHDTS